MPPPKFLENIVILCFERRFSKQNSVIRLKSSILAPPKFFGPSQIFGLATPLREPPLDTEGSNLTKRQMNSHLAKLQVSRKEVEGRS